MNKAEIEALVTEFGGTERVIGIFLDNPGDLIVNYPEAPKWNDTENSDVELRTIGGVDYLIIHNPDRTLSGTRPNGETWYTQVVPTENIQRISFMAPWETEKPPIAQKIFQG